MGNSCVITTEKKDLGVYMHWNGGRDSVTPILLYCKLSGFRPPELDCYGWARLAQVIGNYFKGGLSVGVDRYENISGNNCDNGVYIIKDWEIIGREFHSGFEQSEYDLARFVLGLDEKQPEEFRIENLEDKISLYLVTKKNDN